MQRMTPEETELFLYDGKFRPYDTPEGRAAAPQWLKDLRPGDESEAAVQASPPRFPSAPDVRRQILIAIAKDSEKYARSFDRGSLATVSLIGTESWADYGAVVLQMAILDTLLSIEEKLVTLLGESRTEVSDQTRV